MYRMLGFRTGPWAMLYRPTLDHVDAGFDHVVQIPGFVGAEFDRPYTKGFDFSVGVLRPFRIGLHIGWMPRERTLRT